MDRHFINNLWRWKCGLPEIERKIYKTGRIKLEELEKSEWSDEFELLMRNRLLFGAFRYGLFKNAEPNIELIKDVIRRIKEYIKTGNQEFLVDAANLCMCEFITPSVSNAHFLSIDDGKHYNKK